MSRIRTIKPEFFRHEALFEAEKKTGLPLRIAFAGLWTVADREGRFRWRPRVMKLDVMPFDDVDFEIVLNELAAHGFISKYQVGGEIFAHIPKWSKHQHINQRESGSELPAPPEDSASTCETISAHGEGKGREGERKGTESRASDVHSPDEYDLLESQLREAAGQEENPNIGMKDLSPIFGLLEAGYDLHKDILPKLRAARAAGKQPSSWRYYVKGIEEAKTANAAIQPIAKVVAAVEFVADVDARWSPLAERYRTEYGKEPPKTSGLGGMGRHFPKTWVDDCLEIPAELRRTA